MVEDSRALAREQADLLRSVAVRLGAHGVGERWQGPARRECEAQLAGLEADLYSVARRLALAAQYAGVHDVRAEL